MNADIYDDIAIESTARDYFGVDFEIRRVVGRDIPTGHTTRATVFLTRQNRLYALVTGHSAITYGDVRKIIRHMGMEIDKFAAPKHDPQYFTHQATERFRQVFPGLRPVGDDDLRYYKQLAPCNPALVRIAAVTDGVIRQFDATDTKNWRPFAKFPYRQVVAK